MYDKRVVGSCPRCGSHDVEEMSGKFGQYLKCHTCKSNISQWEMRKWHIIHNMKGDWGQ